jgi:hypothetical protein
MFRNRCRLAVVIALGECPQGRCRLRRYENQLAKKISVQAAFDEHRAEVIRSSTDEWVRPLSRRPVER